MMNSKLRSSGEVYVLMVGFILMNKCLNHILMFKRWLACMQWRLKRYFV